MKFPYGLKLVNRIVNKIDTSKLIQSKKKNTLQISEDDYFNLVNISTGIYSPLEGFCNYKAYYSIVKKNNIKKKINWTIPILLSCPTKVNSLKKGSFYKLKYKKKIVGVINVEDTFKINKKLFNQKIFGTNDTRHPGVALIKKKRNFFVGGNVCLLKSALPKSPYFILPKKLRSILKNKKNNSTAFTTRNICHAGHFFIHKHILKKIKILYVVIIQGSVNKYNPKVIFETYELIRKKMNLKKRLKIISVFMPTFFAGPKESFLQAIMMQNFGFSNFIVGRDHAGAKSFYGKYESQKIFNKLEGLSLKIFKTKEPKICTKCHTICFDNNYNRCKLCFAREKLIGIDGKFVKNKIIKKDFTNLKGMINPHLITYFRRKKNIFKRVAKN